MALIKLYHGAYLRSGKHGGQSVQESGQGLTLKNKNVVRSWRSPVQLSAKYFTFYAVNQWKLLSSAVKDDWNLWALTYPQQCKLNEFAYLSGYELFVKRNYYLYLSNPVAFAWMMTPVYTVHPWESLTAAVQVDSSHVKVYCVFGQNTGVWDVLLFVSSAQSPGLKYGDTRWRFMTSVRSANQTVDITQAYISHFGVLPVIGQKLFISAVMCGFDNGQFTFHQLYHIAVIPLPPPFVVVKYGTLYNGYVFKDARLIANVNWHVMNYNEFLSIRTALGGATVAGGHMKDTDLTYWLPPNLADNSANFFARGAGGRDNSSGNTVSFRAVYFQWLTYPLNPLLYTGFSINNNTTAIGFGLIPVGSGRSLRLVCDSSIDPGFYTGNDGKLYHTISIGGVVTLASCLNETKFRSGVDIPFHGVNPTYFTNAEWVALRSSASCPPFADWSLI